MSKKNLKFNNTEVNKQPSALNSVDVNQKVVSDKFKHSDKSFNILLATKIIISLDRYVLSYLK